MLKPLFPFSHKEAFLETCKSKHKYADADDSSIINFARTTFNSILKIALFTFHCGCFCEKLSPAGLFLEDNFLKVYKPSEFYGMPKPTF